MGELANCERCNALFVASISKVCRDCHRKEEQDYNTVYDFLKKRINRQATIYQIVEATGVEEALIHKFVREKRLRTSQFPNLTYPCKKCGTGIQDGELCKSCMNELNEALADQEKIDQIADRNVREERTTYYTTGKNQ
ncbi:TIGR03826 family flagellar region protein [Sediminibacillus massiliensis]|uniref:TIGR03826 family flagellar region protein n=1 Tax=Sediminibacillus massiliensis TaxID=1926277 RepID=UPI0009884A2A|nr:TIGR03826 family flagellar region protein [Sediminibacillus massiliensis]